MNKLLISILMVLSLTALFLAPALAAAGAQPRPGPF